MALMPCHITAGPDYPPEWDAPEPIDRQCVVYHLRRRLVIGYEINAARNGFEVFSVRAGDVEILDWMSSDARDEILGTVAEDQGLEHLAGSCA